MSGRFVQIRTKGDLAAEMYRHEKSVAMELAKHVAALLTEVDHYPTDWQTVYHAASVRVGKARMETP